MRGLFRAGLMVGAVMVAASACGDHVVTVEQPASLAVAADGQLGTVGDPLPQAVVVTLLSDDGTPMARWSLTWSVVSGDGSLAAGETVTDEEGRAENVWTLGPSTGGQEISVGVTGGSVSASISATAGPGAPATVSIAPDSVNLPGVGGTEQLTAAVQDRFGNGVADASVTWSSSSDGIATVDAAGVVSSTGQGTAEITARSGNATGGAKVVVEATASVSLAPAVDTLEAIDEQVTLTAAVVEDGGATVTDPAIVWSSSDPAVASVDGAGVVTAEGAGTARIAADYDGRASDTATVVVRQVASSLDISPPERTVQLGTTTTLSAVARDANGHGIAGAEYAWASTNTAIFTVVSAADDAVTIEGQGLGSAQLTVAAGDLTQGADVTVIEGPVADSVAITPPLDTLAIGGTVQLALNAWSADGTALTDPDVSWTSSATGVATADGTGTVAAVGEGVAMIRGAVHGIADSATVAVVGATGLLSTAFFGGEFEAEAAPGTSVAVPVRLDLSRVSADGDLGSVQFELEFDPLVMSYDSASVLDGGVANTPSSGTVSYAFASTTAQGTDDVLLATLHFTLDPDLQEGDTISLDLIYTATPTDTDVNDYSVPVAITGTLRVTP